VVSDGEAAITQFKPIPSAVEFSTQLAIVEQNTVFVLQEGDSGRRNLLSGSGAGWREI
jgi:hypothetical protein